MQAGTPATQPSAARQKASCKPQVCYTRAGKVCRTKKAERQARRGRQAFTGLNQNMRFASNRGRGSNATSHQLHTARRGGAPATDSTEKRAVLPGARTRRSGYVQNNPKSNCAVYRRKRRQAGAQRAGQCGGVIARIVLRGKCSAYTAGHSSR